MATIIPAADYLYLCRFASVEHTQPHINGVFVDTPKKRLTSTDGHRLGLLDMADDMISDGAPFTLTNSKTLQQLCKASRNERAWLKCFADRVEIVVSTAGGAQADNLDDYPSTRIATSVPAASAYVGIQYPEYERLIPSTVSDKTNGFGFNAEYLADFAGPNKKHPMVTLVPSDNSPALVFNTDPRFIGVLMPIRGGHTPQAAAAKVALVLGRSAASAEAA